MTPFTKFMVKIHDKLQLMQAPPVVHPPEKTPEELAEDAGWCCTDPEVEVIRYSDIVTRTYHSSVCGIRDKPVRLKDPEWVHTDYLYTYEAHKNSICMNCGHCITDADNVEALYKEDQKEARRSSRKIATKKKLAKHMYETRCKCN